MRIFKFDIAKISVYMCFIYQTNTHLCITYLYIFHLPLTIEKKYLLLKKAVLINKMIFTMQNTILYRLNYYTNRSQMAGIVKKSANGSYFHCGPPTGIKKKVGKLS